MKKRSVVIMALAAMFVCPNLHAVEFAYEAGAEVVSSYLWRGQYNGGLSFQPDLEIGFNALDEAIEFRAGVWGNIGASDWKFRKDQGDDTGYTMFMPELDVNLRLKAYGASVGLTHYYYCDGSNFFSWQSVDELLISENSSTTEVWVGYDFSHFFDVGVYINWYTMIAGNDLIYNQESLSEEPTARRAWSSYLEIGYDYTWDNIGLTLGGQIGMSPWKSDMYGTSRFAVTNLSVKLNKEWEFDVVTLDLFAQGSLNPHCIDKSNVFIDAAGNDKLYMQKLNGCIGLGVWF